MAAPLKTKESRRAEPAPARIEAVEAPGADAAPLRLATILVVDDRQDKRLAMKSIIEDLGQNIVEASSGREALRHLLNQDVAVILLDVNMPGMDGFETAALIRESKRLENVPIIFVSAISDTETHVSRGYSLGAVDYILAPIIPEILRAKVSVFVELYKTNDKVRQQTEALRLAHGELENRVEARTRELAEANQSLLTEIQERQRAQENLRQLNGELEERVSRRTEELLLANQELEAFSYSLAHDLRAPFRQIHGYSELLQKDFASLLPGEGQTYIKRIASKSREMGQMVDDLLHLFGVAKGQLDLGVVKLDDVAEEVLATAKESSEGRAIVWIRTPLPAVKCSYSMVKQVFENLISNAIKYTRPRNPAHIEIGVAQLKGENAIFVRDDGIGFDMASAGNLFGVFQRLHRSEEFEGTGVGLALASRIVRKHGGRIWAEGKVGHGATFFFTLSK